MTKHERPWLEGAKAAVGDTSEQVDPTAPPAPVTVQPEAADRPDGVKPLAAVLQDLAGILPGLKAALERKPPVERLTLRLDEVADSLGMSRRAIERERSRRSFPHA